MVNKKGRYCRDDWYSKDTESACGFIYDKGEKIFDSQVRCNRICEPVVNFS